MKNEATHELLTAEEEINLGRILRSEKEDSPLYIESFKKLVESNIRLVAKASYDLHTKTGVEHEDLMSEGYVGLMVAVEKYDPDKNIDSRFATYALWWINQKMRLFVNRNIITHIPNYISCEAIKYRKLIASTEKELTREEIKETLGITNRELILIEQANVRSISLSIPVETESCGSKALTIQDMLHDEKTPHPDKCSMIKERDILVSEAMEKLTPMEKDIITSQYLLEEKIILKDIGDKYNYSAERIRQIREETILKLRKILSGKDLEFI
jgi:RNA polymerase sigma factor (sigma-70 family)